MTRNSIRLRLLLSACAMIVAVMAVAVISMSLIFQRHMEKRVENELEKHLIQLAGAVEVTPSGAIGLTQELADPRFQLPMSGLYWQIDLAGRPLARSRSLWDQRLTVPTPPVEASDVHINELPGPDGQTLFALERAILLEQSGAERLFVFTIGLSRDEISGTVLSFTRDVVPTLGALGLVLLVATWAQISLGLRPLSLIETAVNAVRKGERNRIDQPVADEVRPMVSALNGLLEANETRSREAWQRAADLAHGLRTPLAVLGAVSRSLEHKGLNEEAGKIRLQTGHMHQQVEWELSKAISSARDAADWLDLSVHVGRLVRVVRMVDEAGAIAWEVNLPQGTEWQIADSDLNEIFGNILENAQKWARSLVRVGLDRNGCIIIEDDGPGVEEADLAKLTMRGFSNDRRKEGSGLGLAIVQQLADKNECGLAFARSELGGLRVALTPPDTRFRLAGNANVN
jgi:signal transduction histidine kinase